MAHFKKVVRLFSKMIRWLGGQWSTISLLNEGFKNLKRQIARALFLHILSEKNMLIALT